jgi:hypothetical protein
MGGALGGDIMKALPPKDDAQKARSIAHVPVRARRACVRADTHASRARGPSSRPMREGLDRPLPTKRAQRGEKTGCG